MGILRFSRVLSAVVGSLAIVWGFLHIAPFLIPPTAEAAANQVGTHVAYGDPLAQAKIIEFVKSKSPPAGYPLTVMVNMYAQSDEIAPIVNAVRGTEFSLIVRATGITGATTAADARDFALFMNTVDWGQGSKPVIVFGNELNALSAGEWGGSVPSSLEAAANVYGPLLTAVAISIDPAKYDLAGVALDPYHINSAVTFSTGITNTLRHPNVTAFATNVYEGVSGANGEGLTAGPNLYQAVASAPISAPKGIKIFTEFGYNPFDTDPQKHIDFYTRFETEALPGGFQYATALVPNLCSSVVSDANHWYFYVVGKIYDETLKEVTENCETVQAGGTFIYPGPADVYYNSGGSFEERGGKFTDLMAENYLLTCSPQIQFKPTLTPANPNISVPTSTGRNALVNLLNYCETDQPNCVFDIGNQTISVIADNAVVPFLRSNRTGRTGSFEGFFTTDLEGLASITNTLNNPSSALLYSPAFKLWPRDATCKANIDFLKAMETSCTQMGNAQGTLYPDESARQAEFYASQDREFNQCGLDTKILDTKLSQILSDVRSTVGDEDTYCDSDAFKFPSVGQSELANLVMQVQPVTPSAYRIAYMIVYVSSASTSPPGPLEMITRLFRPLSPEYLQNIFKVIPVLIPANFGASQNDRVFDITGATVDNASFDSAFKRAIWPIFPKELHEQVAEEAGDKKQEVLGKMREFGGNTVNDTGMVWLPYCGEGAGSVPISQSGLNEEDARLNCYFADFVNANLNLGADGNVLMHNDQLAPCRFYEDQAGGETAAVLSEPVKPEWMTAPLSSYLQSGDAGPSVGVSGRVYSSTGQMVDLINEETAKMRVFLAIPSTEFQLIRDYEKLLLQSQLGKQLYDLVVEEVNNSDLETNGYLRMMNVLLQLDGGAERSYIAELEPDPPPPSPNPSPQPLGSVTVRAQFAPQGDANPVLWGGWLSKFLYTYTANVTSPEGGKAHDSFLLTQRRLEPYWLSGVSVGLPGNEARTVNCVNVWVEPEVALEHAEALRANLPAQRDLWDAYYVGYLSDAQIPRQCSDGVNPDPADYSAPAVQYLFESPPECDGLVCYEAIIRQALSRQVNGKVVDPYIAISIALNENGGLKTARNDRYGQHFGVITPIEGRVKECSNDVVYLGAIDEKMDRMFTTLLNDNDGVKSGSDALVEYGYTDGGSAMIRLTKLLSNEAYSPECVLE